MKNIHDDLDLKGNRIVGAQVIIEEDKELTQELSGLRTKQSELESKIKSMELSKLNTSSTLTESDINSLFT